MQNHEQAYVPFNNKKAEWERMDDNGARNEAINEYIKQNEKKYKEIESITLAYKTHCKNIISEGQKIKKGQRQDVVTTMDFGAANGGGGDAPNATRQWVIPYFFA